MLLGSHRKFNLSWKDFWVWNKMRKINKIMKFPYFLSVHKPNILSVKLFSEKFMLVSLYIDLIVHNPCTWGIHTGERVGFTRLFCCKTMGPDPELDAELSRAHSLPPHKKDWPCHVSCWKHKSKRASTYPLSLSSTLCLLLASLPLINALHIRTHTFVIWK